MHSAKSNPAKIFLTAEWRWLAMLNYEIEPGALAPFVPAGTELDFWRGKAFVSMIGFLFQNARIAGIPIPFHRGFEEVNLRFYVHRKTESGWRRGVVFIRELVPRWAVAFVARRFYNENYYALRMAHRIEKTHGEIESVFYSWWLNGNENFLKVAVSDRFRSAANGSLSEFIAEHYWGYARQRDGSTVEYQVEHPRWLVWEATAAELRCDAASMYGNNFRTRLSRPPASAFLADGSEVRVHHGVKLRI